MGATTLEPLGSRDESDISNIFRIAINGIDGIPISIINDFRLCDDCACIPTPIFING